MAKKFKKIGELRFCLDDWREDKFNESTDLTYALYGDSADADEILSLEKYHSYCKQFAAAMGFAEKSINDWFGEW